MTPNAEVSAVLVEQLCRHAGVPVAETFSLAEVADLLRRCEYDIDADLITALLGYGRIPSPARSGEWEQTHVHALAAFLEGHRLWAAGSEVHRAKKSAARREIESIIAVGGEVPGGGMGLLGMLVVMAQSDHREIRESYLEVILHRLRSLGVDLHA